MADDFGSTWRAFLERLTLFSVERACACSSTGISGTGATGLQGVQHLPEAPMPTTGSQKSRPIGLEIGAKARSFVGRTGGSCVSGKLMFFVTRLRPRIGSRCH